jgi:hypothetical protein
MSLNGAIVAALCASTLVCLPAIGQENRISRADIRSEASAPFVKGSTADVARQRASFHDGVLCTYRFFFNNSHNTKAYSPYKGSIGLKKNSDQACATYVFRFSVKRWSPITPAAARIFDPKIEAGAATDFNFERRSFPRIEHRGSFYNSATLHAGGLNDLYRFSNSEAPAIVFGYNF